MNGQTDSPKRQMARGVLHPTGSGRDVNGLQEAAMPLNGSDIGKVACRSA